MSDRKWESRRRHGRPEHTETEKNDLRAHLRLAHDVKPDGWEIDPFAQHAAMDHAEVGHMHRDGPLSFVLQRRARTPFEDVGMLDAPEDGQPRDQRLAALAQEAVEERPELANDVPWPTGSRGGRKKKQGLR